MAMTALGNAVTPVAALVTLPILSYTLGVTGRGEIAAATAPLLLAVTAATFGIPEAVAYLVAKSPAALPGVARRGAWLILLSGALATVICVLASTMLAGGDPALGRLIVVASLAVIPTTVVLILRACAAGLQRWRLVAVEQALTAVLRLAGIAGLAVAGRLTPLSAVIVIAAAPVLGGLAYLPLRQHHRRATVPGADPVGASTRHIVSYGSRIWIGSLTGVLLARLDQTIMTPLAGTYQLGLYAVAASVGDAALILHSAVRDVTFTADAARQDDQRLCASARISGFLSIAVAVILAALIPIGLPLVFGPDFAPAIPVGPVDVGRGCRGGAGFHRRGGVERPRPPGPAQRLPAGRLRGQCRRAAAARSGAGGDRGRAGDAGRQPDRQPVEHCLPGSRRSTIPARQFYGLRRTDIAIMSGKAQDLARFAGRRGRTAKLR